MLEGHPLGIFQVIQKNFAIFEPRGALLKNREMPMSDILFDILCVHGGNKKFRIFIGFLCAVGCYSIKHPEKSDAGNQFQYFSISGGLDIS